MISDFSSTQAWFSPATNTRTATHFSREKGLDTIMSTLVSEFFLLAVLGLVDVRFRLAYLTYGRVCAYAQACIASENQALFYPLLRVTTLLNT